MTPATVRTVGVEEELLLVDADGAVTPVGADVVESSVEIESEFKLEQAEIASEPTRDLAELRSQLLQRRQAVARAAQRNGGHAVAIATSPLAAEPHETPGGRYARMARDFGIIAGQQLTCGQHVHVAVSSRQEGVAILDRIRIWLPVLRAVSANSPFAQGLDSGYQSYRSIQWGLWPTSGPTEVFESEAAYDATVGELIGSGAALDEGMIYFDARLSVRYPTLEIRVADVCTDVDDAVLVAALCRALVETAAHDYRDAVAPRRVGVNALRAATWRAARFGLTGELVDPTGSGCVSAAEVLSQLQAHLEPALRDSGDLELVTAGLTRVLETGSGARRQRDRFAQTGDLADVVLDAARRTLET